MIASGLSGLLFWLNNAESIASVSVIPDSLELLCIFLIFVCLCWFHMDCEDTAVIWLKKKNYARRDNKEDTIWHSQHKDEIDFEATEISYGQSPWQNPPLVPQIPHERNSLLF